MSRILLNYTFDVKDKPIVMSTANRLTFPVMSRAKPSEILRQEFGSWLQKEREARGLSQKFVAEKANVTVTQLSRIENGQSGTRRDTVIMLASIIGISEVEALRKFSPESVPQLPEELENIPFYEFDKQDLQEIVAFINFKLSQKRSAQTGETIKPDRNTHKKAAEPEIRNDLSREEDRRAVTPYRVKAGQLIPDTKVKDKAHTSKKPSDK
jgi:transcriptional regulator with XRE-family HTH domain